MQATTVQRRALAIFDELGGIRKKWAILKDDGFTLANTIVNCLLQEE
jgi:hypothetical protein